MTKISLQNQMSSFTNFEATLNETEKEFYTELRNKAIARYSVSEPSMKIGAIIEETIQQFTLLRWTLDVDTKKLIFDRADYEKMNTNYGPDLTALPRTRIITKDRPIAHRNTGPNKYANFVKEISQTDEAKNIDSKERLKWIASKWQELTEEEKNKYI